MWKHIRAIILLPGMVTLVIPGTILRRGGLDTLGFWQSVPASVVVLPVLGVICICLGLSLMVATIRLFVTVGKGTLAPWNPTQRLVVLGVYRNVRNPMISGVLCVPLGESVLTASLPLFHWFLLFAVINATYIPLWEEPGLVKRFGQEYLTYKRNVPRWVPRRTPMGGWGEKPHLNAGMPKPFHLVDCLCLRSRCLNPLFPSLRPVGRIVNFPKRLLQVNGSVDGIIQVAVGLDEPERLIQENRLGHLRMGVDEMRPYFRRPALSNTSYTRRLPSPTASKPTR